VILAGRRINDAMGGYVTDMVIKLMIKRKIQISGSRVLVLGLTFKENCPDLRNSRVIDIIRELQGYGVLVDVHDPWVDPAEARHEYEIELLAQPEPGAYDAVIIAVGHEQFRDKAASGLRALCKPDGILFDVKYLLPAAAVDGRL
jgi:UDP-N-acetyl-D-galactosamine dehydrogenase